MGELAAVWRRVSSGGQDEENQTARLADHCEARGYDVVYEFVLHDRSAFHGEHEPELAELLEGFRSGHYTVVVITHSSRIDRRDDLDAQVEFLAAVRMAGGRVESVSEPQFGTADLVGRILTLVAQHANAEKSRTIATQVRDRHRRIDDAGAFRGKPPLGYTPVERDGFKWLVPDEHGPVVGGIFRRVASGWSLARVSRWLRDEHGIGRDEATIANMIRRSRDVYALGRYAVRRSDGVTRYHVCEPLVSPDEADAADAALRARDPRREARYRVTPDPDYSGALTCPCGGRMYRVVAVKKGVTYTYYRCRNTSAEDGRSCRRSVRQADADAAADALMGGSTWPEHERVIIPGSSHAAKLETVERDLRELSSRGLDDDEEDAERARLRTERNRLRSLPVTPARWEIIATGRTEGDAWNTADHEERVNWLRFRDFTVYAAKGTAPEGVLSAAVDGVCVWRVPLEDTDSLYVSDGQGGVLAEDLPPELQYGR